MHMCLTYQAIPGVLFHTGSNSKKNASRRDCTWLKSVWDFHKIKTVSCVWLVFLVFETYSIWWMKIFGSSGPNECKAVQILLHAITSASCKPVLVSMQNIASSVFTLRFPEGFLPFSLLSGISPFWGCLQNQRSCMIPLIWPLGIFLISW